MAEPPRANPPRPPQGDSTESGGISLSGIFWIVFGVSLATFGLVTVPTFVLSQYGYSLFLLLPLATGFVSARLCNRNRQWHWGRTLSVVSLTVVTTGFLMLGIEGSMCILMASALAVVLAAIGTLIAWLVRKLGSRHHTLLVFVGVICPLSMGFEHQFPATPPLLEQTTVIEIDAPPDVVWRFVPAFPKIESPPQGLLANGMAYPMESTMRGEGVGAHRSCVLSTGAMPEIITRWEPGRALEFDVLQTPPAMVETNPFFHVHPEHVEGYFTVTHGRFVLVPLPNGRTRVEGTSWFKHDLWPQFYWAPLTRRIVKDVHERVLTHIKELAEQAHFSAAPL